MYTNQNKVCICGSEENSNSSRAELNAFLNALEMAINSQTEAIIFTDSAYVANPIKLNWLNNKWKSQDYKGIKNIDLWLQVKSLLELSKAKVEQIPRKLNSEADKFSKLAREGVYGYRSVIHF
jgi:ribonuclease HI